MDWVQFSIFLLSVFGLWLWSRTESRADARHMDVKIDALISTIQEEMKDFHGRLCAIEERRKQ